MSTRFATFLSAALMVGLSGSALAQAPAPAQQDPNAPVLSETFDDWTLRCFNVRGPAPCDMLQVAVNRQTKQRVLSVSIAFVPERNAFAMQIVVPLGVALAKGLTVNAGDHTMKNVHFNRCSREGCYVEVIVDSDTVTALGKVGASTMLVVQPYGKNTDAKLPLSLKGWNSAVARLKVVAAQRATRTGAPQTTPGAAPAPAPAPAHPPAHAPAAPAPGH